MQGEGGWREMTGPQRKAHFMLWLVLGPLALVGLVLALVWRPPVPVQEGELPGAEAATQTDQQAGDGRQRTNLHHKLLRERNSSLSIFYKTKRTPSR